jgi:hypothetical protein
VRIVRGHAKRKADRIAQDYDPGTLADSRGAESHQAFGLRVNVIGADVEMGASTPASVVWLQPLDE